MVSGFIRFSHLKFKHSQVFVSFLFIFCNSMPLLQNWRSINKFQIFCNLPILTPSEQFHILSCDSDTFRSSYSYFSTLMPLLVTFSRLLQTKVNVHSECNKKDVAYTVLNIMLTHSIKMFPMCCTYHEMSKFDTWTV